MTIEDVDLSGPEPKSHGTYIVQARAVVNCAGLGSGRIAALAGIDLDEVRFVDVFDVNSYLTFD